MPSWWGKPPSKEGKRKKSRGNFFEAIHRKFKAGSEDKKTANTGAVQRFTSDIRAEKGSTLSVSLSPSLEVSRCHSFAEEPRAQPLPLPVQLASVGYTNSDIRTSSMVLPVSPLFSVYDPRKPVAPDGWGDFGTASISSNSSFDTSDQPESRLFSPQASDYESGNVTAINSPSRLIDHSSLAARRLKDQGKLINLPSHDHTLRRRRPLSSHVTKLQIPPRAGFISAPDSSISSPLRSPVGVCSQKEVNRSDGCARRACSDLKCCSPGSGKNSGHDSVGDMLLVCPQSRCSAECSPILSPRMTSPSCRSRIQSGCTTPLHSRAGGHCNNLPLDKPDDRRPQSHKLPLPPVSVSNSLSRYPGRGESSPSPVSRWKKGRLIGSGTFGHVYMGFNSETGEMCAMKEVLLFSDDPNSKECVQQLRQEVTLLSSLTHPNIVQYFGSETVDNRLYIYLEYVSGGSIHKLLGDYGQLGESAIRSFTLQILSGLAYLHARHTVHRDIKGANILVDPSGRVKLADFGMAKHIAGQSGPLSFKGSPYWMAPEVIKNSDGSSLSVDVWSLGCTVIEMATAKPPWSQHEGVAALFKVGYSKELPAIPDHLSNEGKDFVRKCLQRNPLDRPSAAELLKHPFVKNLAPSGNYLSITEPSEVDNASRYTGSGHLSRGFDSGSRSSEPRMSKHLSCPVSPVRSPLLPSKSSQTTCRKRSPYISSPHTPGSSTPYKGSIRAHLYNSTCHSHEGITARMPQRSLFTNGDPLYRKAKEESLMGIPENSQVKRGTNFMSK